MRGDGRGRFTILHFDIYLSSCTSRYRIIVPYSGLSLASSGVWTQSFAGQHVPTAPRYEPDLMPRLRPYMPEVGTNTWSTDIRLLR